MDRQAYHDMYYVDMEPAEYYASVSELSGRDPLATARTLDTDISMPPSARAKLFNISAEVKNYFHEYGTPMPPLMEGCTVVDLGCGSGRDTYLAAQFVGAAFDMTDLFRVGYKVLGHTVFKEDMNRFFVNQARFGNAVQEFVDFVFQRAAAVKH